MPSFSEPRSAVMRWFAEPGKNISGEVRARLIAAPFGTAVPTIVGSLNAVAVTLVAFSRSGNPKLLAFAALECLLLAVRLILLRRRGKPADALFATGLLWAVLQSATIWVVVTSEDVVAMIIVLATSLAVIGGIIARNFAAPRYAFAQVLAIDLTFKAAFLSIHPAYAPLIVAQLLLFMAYNVSILKQHSDMAVRALTGEIESREQAFADPLTKLLNRRGLAARAERMSTGSLVLFYIDLDGFKSVNDRCGHAVGDRLLQEVGVCLRSLFGEEAAISRMGGDEFLVLTADRGIDDIRASGARIIALLSVPYQTQENGLAVIGASVGAARWDECGGTLESCMAAADGALYKAKSEGKGRCILAMPGPDDVRHASARAA